MLFSLLIAIFVSPMSVLTLPSLLVLFRSPFSCLRCHTRRAFRFRLVRQGYLRLGWGVGLVVFPLRSFCGGGGGGIVLIFAICVPHVRLSALLCACFAAFVLAFLSLLLFVLLVFFLLVSFRLCDRLSVCVSVCVTVCQSVFVHVSVIVS